MLRALTLAGALFLGVALPTPVEAAYTTGWVNIRSGPGMHYPVVYIAWPNVPFDVHDCGRYWCSITYNGVEGWISARWVTDRQ
jgi:uncharacterized protein YraI